MKCSKGFKIIVVKWLLIFLPFRVFSADFFLYCFLAEADCLRLFEYFMGW